MVVIMISIQRVYLVVFTGRRPHVNTVFILTGFKCFLTSIIVVVMCVTMRRCLVLVSGEVDEVGHLVDVVDGVVVVGRGKSFAQYRGHFTVQTLVTAGRYDVLTIGLRVHD